MAGYGPDEAEAVIVGRTYALQVLKENADLDQFLLKETIFDLVYAHPKFNKVQKTIALSAAASTVASQLKY